MVISPAEADELEELHKEYAQATAACAEAIRLARGDLRGIHHRRMLDEDARAGRAIRRIREIYGTV